MTHRKRDVDHGWAWVVLTGSFFGMVITGMAIYSSGIFLTAILEEIDPNLTKASWITAVFAGSNCVTGPVVGLITKKYGCRASAFLAGLCYLCGFVGASFSKDVASLVSTFGIIAGFGKGFALSSCSVIVGHYFEKYRAWASGITVSGAAFGMFIGPPIVRLMLNKYGLSGTLLVLGAVACNYFVVAMLMRRSAVEKREQNSFPSKSKISDENAVDSMDKGELVKMLPLSSAKGNKTSKLDQIGEPGGNKTHAPDRKRGYFIFRFSCNDGDVGRVISIPFLCYLASVTAWQVGDSCVYTHLPNYAISKGTTKTDSATLFTAMGITSLVSRLLAGFSANDPNIGSGLLHMGLLGLSGVLTITFPLFSDRLDTQMLYTTGYGLYSGGIHALVNPLTVDLVGVINLATAFGLVVFASGIGSLTGPPVAGLIYDRGRRYDYSFVFAGSMFLCGSLLTLLMSIHIRKKNLDLNNPTSEREITFENIPLDDCVEEK